MRLRGSIRSWCNLQLDWISNGFRLRLQSGRKSALGRKQHIGVVDGVLLRHRALHQRRHAPSP